MNKIKKGDVITLEMVERSTPNRDILEYFGEKYPNGFKIILKNLKQVNFFYLQFLIWDYDYALWDKWRGGANWHDSDTQNPQSIEALWRLL